MKVLQVPLYKNLILRGLIIATSLNPCLMLSAQTKSLSAATKHLVADEVPAGLSQEDKDSLREFALEYFGDSPNITEAQILNAVTVIATQAPHLKALDGTRRELDQNFFAALAEYRRTGSHHLALIWVIPIIVWIIIDVATTTTTAHAPVVEIPPTESTLCQQQQEQFDRVVQDLISRPAPSAEICEYLQAMRHFITTCQWGASSRVRDLVLNYCPEI